MILNTYLLVAMTTGTEGEVNEVDELISQLRELIGNSDHIKDLNKYQQECLRIILSKYIKDRELRGIVQMPTGTGKTVLAAAIILAILILAKKEKHNKLVAVYFAPRQVIREQTYRTFKEIIEKSNKLRVCVAESGCKLKEIVVSDIKGALSKRQKENIEFIKGLSKPIQEYYLNINKSKRSTADGVVIIMTPQLWNSFCKSKNEQHVKDLIKYSDVLIFDEAHTYYIGEKTLKNLKELIFGGSESTKKIIIGLTATPVRESIKLFGKLLYSKSSYDAMKDGLLTPKLKIVYYKTNIDVSKIKIESGDAVQTIDPWRLAIVERAERYADIIVRELREISKELGRVPKTLVMAANTTEADILSKKLKDKLNENKLQCLVLTAHYKRKGPHEIVSMFKRKDSGILITVNMVDIGFDDPNIEVLIIARPIKNPVTYVQVRGRVLRKATDPNNLKSCKYALIIDLVGEVKERELERKVRDVETGKLIGKEFDEAMKELRGIEGEVPKARAPVNIKKEGSEVIPSEEKKEKEVSTKTEEHPLMISDLVSKLYQRCEVHMLKNKIELKIITNDGEPHYESYIIGRIDSGGINIGKLKENLRMYLRLYIEKYALELRKVLLQSKLSEDDVINNVTDKLVNTIKEQLNEGVKTTSKVITEEAPVRRLYRVHLRNLLYNVVNLGKVSFGFQNHVITLKIKTAKKGNVIKRYIVILIDGREYAKIKVRSKEDDTLKSLKNAFRNNPLLSKLIII